MTINEIVEITTRRNYIDGEEVYVLDNSMQLGIKRLKEKIKNDDNCLFSVLSKDLEFICEQRDFAIAFRAIKWKNKKDWIPCLIFNHNGEWRKVVLQYAKCLNCDWTGCVANPTDPDLYIGSRDRFRMMYDMNRLSFCKCPRCGKDISCKAIWVEDSKK